MKGSKMAYIDGKQADTSAPRQSCCSLSIWVKEGGEERRVIADGLLVSVDQLKGILYNYRNPVVKLGICTGGWPVYASEWEWDDESYSYLLEY